MRLFLERLLIYTSRWLWRLVVLLVITIAVLVSLGRELAPLLNDNKELLERHLFVNTEVPIKIGSVEAQWSGLSPELVLGEVLIDNKVLIEHAVIRIDILGSVKSRTAVFEQLSIETATVDLTYDPVDMEVEENNTELKPQFYLRLLFGSADIQLKDIQINLFDTEGSVTQMYLENIAVENKGSRHWLNGFVYFSEHEKPLEVLTKFYGSPDDILGGRGNVYIDMGDKRNLRHIWPLLRKMAPNNLSSMSFLDQGGINAKAWIIWDDEKYEWLADVDIENFNFQPKQQEQAWLLSLQGVLSGHGGTRNGDYLLTRGINLSLNKTPLTLPDLQLNVRENRNDDENRVLELSIPELDVTTLHDYFPLVPSEKGREVLGILSPGGHLDNFSVTLPLTEKIDPETILIRSNLRDVSASSWRGAPSLWQVNGYLEANPFAGFVELDSTEGFSMHYPQIFNETLSYDRAKGRVRWSIDRESKYVYVGGTHLGLQSEQGRAKGDFWLQFPPRGIQRDPEMYLAIGLVDTKAMYRHQYLPYTLPEALLTWLERSIHGGEISDTAFIYRGALKNITAHNKSIQYYANVSNAILRFDPEWPVLEDITGLIVVDEAQVHAEVEQASLYELDMGQGEVHVDASNKGQYIKVSGQLDGSAEDALRILRETPLRETFGATFDSWHITETIAGSIDIGVPIGEVDKPAYQDIKVTFDNNDLGLNDLDLGLEKLRGQLHYSSAEGLSSPHLDATVWGQHMVIKLEPQEDNDGLQDIRLTLQGMIEIAEVARWSKQPWLDFLEGSAEMNIALDIFLDEEAVTDTTHQPVEKPFGLIGVKSSLQGVSLDLPEPLQKTAEQDMPLNLSVALWKERQVYDFILGDSTSGYINHSASGPIFGDVRLNQSEGPDRRKSEELLIQASLPEATLSEWLEVVERYENLAGQQAVVQNDDDIEKVATGFNNIPVFIADIGVASIGYLDFQDIILRIEQHKGGGADEEDEHWNIGFENALAVGEYRYYGDHRIPEVSFKTIFIESEDEEKAPADKNGDDSEKEKVDPLAGVVFEEIPALKVEVEKLLYGEADLGEWQFEIVPGSQGLTLKDFHANMAALTLTGIKDGQQARLSWGGKGQQLQTRFVGKIIISDTLALAEQLGFDAMIECREFILAGDINWAGSPAMLAFESMFGNLQIDSTTGVFLNNSPTSDFMRLINIFNLSAWAQRLQMDFSDMSQKGISYNTLTANVNLDHGRIVFREPLIMDSPSSEFTMDGTVDSVANSIDATLVVTLPVGDNATWITALAAGLPAAVGVYLASKVFAEQIDNVSSLSYGITGTLDDPEVKFKHLLKDTGISDSEVVDPNDWDTDLD